MSNLPDPIKEAPQGELSFELRKEWKDSFDRLCDFYMGTLLTFIDAAISDPEQRKAFKDVVKNNFWTNLRLPLIQTLEQKTATLAKYIGDSDTFEYLNTSDMYIPSFESKYKYTRS